MSLKLNERYPGRFNNPSADYPDGSFKNRTAPAAKDGSYLEQDWANDREGFFQSLLAAAGIEANGVVDKVGASQVFDAIQKLKQSQSGTAFTTTGPSAALVMTPTPAITAYVAGQRFRVKFNRASTGADTINISGVGAKNIKQYNSAGAKVAAVFAVGQLADAEYDGADFVILDQLPTTIQATEAVEGVAKIATNSQVTAGVDDSTFVTPLKLQTKISKLYKNIQTLTGARSIGTSFVNGSPGPIIVNVTVITSAANQVLSLNIDGVLFTGGSYYLAGSQLGASWTVPAGSTYFVPVLGYTLNKWLEASL